MVQSREELERGAAARIHTAMRERGLDPREWEFQIQLEGVGGNTRCSMSRHQKSITRCLTAADFPRPMNVQLLKKTRDRPCTLFTISIIDFLQKWTCKKVAAQCLKACEQNKATIPADQYGRRFVDHFKKCFSVGAGVEEELGCPETPPVVKPASHDEWFT